MSSQEASMPEVSVLLPVRNGARTLALAMVSVLQQSFRDFELLVLDDGSIDASADVALSFRDARVSSSSSAPRRSAKARPAAYWNIWFPKPPVRRATIISRAQ